MKREETIIIETINGLKQAAPYVTQKGEYRYDKVPPWVVENAIFLLQHYQGILETMRNYKKHRG